MKLVRCQRDSPSFRRSRRRLVLIPKESWNCRCATALDSYTHLAVDLSVFRIAGFSSTFSMQQFFGFQDFLFSRHCYYSFNLVGRCKFFSLYQYKCIGNILFEIEHFQNLEILLLIWRKTLSTFKILENKKRMKLCEETEGMMNYHCWLIKRCIFIYSIESSWPLLGPKMILAMYKN